MGLKAFFSRLRGRKLERKLANAQKAPLNALKSKRWYEATDDLPTTQEWLLGYTEVYGSYHVCHFIPSRGWIDTSGNSLQNISHWWDEPLHLPFEIRNELDTYLAEKHGFKVR